MNPCEECIGRGEIWAESPIVGLSGHVTCAECHGTGFQSHGDTVRTTIENYLQDILVAGQERALSYGVFELPW